MIELSKGRIEVARKHVFCSWDGCRDGLQNSCLCVGNQDIKPSRLDANGTAIEGVCVTSAANRPVICPVRPGHCPGSKLVWRNF